MEAVTAKPILADNGTIASRWNKFDAVRQRILDRAVRCAQLTIPSLFPDKWHMKDDALPTPYQGFGARGVNNLSSKLLLALMPPNQPFFRLTMDAQFKANIEQSGFDIQEMDDGLAKLERAIMEHMETTGARIPSFTAIKLLVVTGNALMYIPPKGNTQVFKLHQYVVKRDPSGNVLEIIIRERIHPSALPTEVRDNISAKDRASDEPLDIYTHVKRKERFWTVVQEVSGELIESTRGSYKLDDNPWLPLRWARVEGEDYGRGLVEEQIGDLESLESLTKAVVEGAEAAARVIYLLSPNGTTRAKALADAQNLEIINGDANDVTVLSLDKFPDFKVALETIARIETRLSHAFLLNSAAQRKGERVTAEEIRYVAGELEDALGGPYSVLSQEMQLPQVKRYMAQLSKEKSLPTLPSDKVRPVITTGLDALGRGHDLNKLRLFADVLTGVFGPEMMQQRLKPEPFIKRVGTSIGVDVEGLVITDEEFQQQQAQTQQQQAALEGAVKAAPTVAKGLIENGQQEPEQG